jgi:predicted MFS family arabinose efflux permease
MAERRGLVLGLLAFMTYGFVMGATALFPSRMRRWSAHHIVADASFFVPLLFFALLLIAALPWWGAAVIALAVGAVLVPIVVRRRTAHQASTERQTRLQSGDAPDYFARRRMAQPHRHHPVPPAR